MGIRLKLIASLAAILIVLTILLGVAFAIREQRTLAALKRDHLQHSAELASIILQEISPEGRERALEVWNKSVPGRPSLRILFNGDHPALTMNESESSLRSPELTTIVVPLRGASGAEAEQLVAAEPAPEAQALFVANLAEHFALGALLTTAAILAVAFVCQRLVVRPVRWLVTAADTMARGDDWEPIRPLARRRDEIGMLSDRLAELSRRLAAAVRSARYGSAHLVALRVRRELEEPIRRLTVGLVTLEATSDGDPDAKREVQQMYDQLHVLTDISNRLGEISSDPMTEVATARRARRGGTRSK